VRLNVPGFAEVQETVADPDPVTLLGVMIPQVRPAGTVSVRATVPENPFRAVIVMVEVALAPVLTAAGEVAEIEKSAAPVTLKVTVAVWEREPLVPVTVTVKEPVADAVQERVEVPEVVVVLRVMLVALRAQLMPDEGETVSERATVPVKLLTAETVIVEVPAFPTVTLTLAGLADTVKLAAAVTL